MQDHVGATKHSLRVLSRGSDLGQTLGSLALAYFAAAAVLVVLLAAGIRFPSVPVLVELARSGLGGLMLASLLPAFAGLLATSIMAAARARPETESVDHGEPIGRAARWPQVIAVVAPALVAMVCAWLLRPRPLPLAAPAETADLLAGAAVVLAFPLLVAERWAAGLSGARLPEAADLRALLLLPVLVFATLGAMEFAAALGFDLSRTLGVACVCLVVATSLELAARAAARGFLPPPEPGLARAAVRSTVARLVSDGVRSRGRIGSPIRQHFGIDFSRSWALAYVRTAALPMASVLLLLGWGLSGVVLVPLDGRAVYERLGAPVAVLHPGLHAILPWPFGFARPIEFGTVHDARLTEPLGGLERIDAEAPPPPSADRLWNQSHAGELTFLIAGRSGGNTSFQTVSADLRVLYRIGLSDAGALRATYGAAEPEALVRAAAGRVAADFFAGQTLDGVLGADREAMAARLRDQVQAALDPFDPGIELLAVVIEAIHPPAGAAGAYHGVQAATIAASASISAERGRALALGAAAAQHAAEIVNEARSAAAEATGGAQTDLTRFTADREAAAVGGPAFLFERYLASITAALAHAPLTVIDHRLTTTGGSVLDLRPPSAAAVPNAGPGME